MHGDKYTQLTFRMVAVAFVDVAGFSRLMADDGVKTVRHWAFLRDTILIPKLESLSGHMVNEAGDAILAEFQSVIGAVTWALDVQAAIRALTQDENTMQIRIGINVDDVIDDGETIRSDGVNIAARIHQLAAPGEIVLTQVARDLVRGRVAATFRDLGAPSLKNIDRPVRVFAVEEKASISTLVRPHASWSSRPTLAILPFRDHGGDDADRYFGEGITEDIIAGVSRSRAMFVVARNSTLQFGDGKQTHKEISAALGVKYLLTGSIRRQPNVLRIHTQLSDVDNDRVVWAEHFGGIAGDIFEFQDKIVSNIVAALEPKVLKAEASHLGARPTESLDAYDCVLRSLSELYRVEAVSYARAQSLLTRAVFLDPGYAQAHAYLAWCLNFVIAEGRSQNMKEDQSRAILHSRQAVDLDPEDAFALTVRGHILGLHEGNPYEAIDYLEDALRLNENMPLAWALSAISYAYLGNASEARDRLLNVWRLTPYDPLNFFFWAAGGLVEFVAGDYEAGIKLLQRSHQAKPHFRANLRLLAAALALNGKKKEARAIGQELLSEDPGFSIAGFMAWYPVKNPQTRENLVMGLSAAGLPETHGNLPFNMEISK